MAKERLGGVVWGFGFRLVFPPSSPEKFVRGMTTQYDIFKTCIHPRLDSVFLMSMWDSVNLPGDTVGGSDEDTSTEEEVGDITEGTKTENELDGKTAVEDRKAVLVGIDKTGDVVAATAAAVLERNEWEVITGPVVFTLDCCAGLSVGGL